MRKTSGGDTLANVEASGSWYDLYYFLVCLKFSAIFLKNGKWDFKNRVELPFHIYYKAVDMIGLPLVSSSMSNLSSDSK